MLIAEIAQLVEHNLAKVGVASSSLVFRSIDDGYPFLRLLVFFSFYTFVQTLSSQASAFMGRMQTTKP